MIAKIRKSLFLKQFIVYICVLLVSFLLLGIVFTSAFKAYYMRQKQNQLIQQADRISEQYALSIYTGIIDNSRISRELRILSDNIGASTLLVARNGRVLFASGDVDEGWIGEYVSEESLNRVVNGETVVTQSSLTSVFSDTALTIAYPIKAEDTVFAALIMNVSVPAAREQLISVYMIISAVLAVCGVVSFIALYFSVKRITKPLIELNEAAKIIAGGDFEKRIETNLTDEVGQLSKSFNEMAQSLDELEQSKRRFISNVSHDIRSPLTSIQGFVTAMLDGTAEPESFERYLRIVRDESGRIVKLANEMLDLNALDDGCKLNLQPFDINAVIRSCAEKAENSARVKKLSLELVFSEERTIVFADKEKIERALENLIENALKFTEHGKITVETENAGERALVSVRDTGIGLTEEEQKHVFDRFYKADEARGKNGSGLGLSIVREFLRAHGETVCVVSEKGAGSVFSFGLPWGNAIDSENI